METLFFIEDHFTTNTLAILTLATAILSQLLALIEYFRLKARWDFFYLDEEGRKSTRSGFHPEYLATSLLVILSIVFLISTNILDKILCSFYNFIFAFLLILTMLYVGSYCIFYIFSNADVKKGLYQRKEYGKITIYKALLSTIKYSIQVLLWFIILKLFISKTHQALALILLIFSCVLLVFLEYNDSKIRIAHFSKAYNIVCIDEPQKMAYCVLATINNEKYYAVKAKIDSENILNLYLDTKICLPANQLQVNKIKFDKRKRIYNDHEIPCGKFIIG